MKVRLGVTVLTVLLLAGCSPSGPTAGDTPTTTGSPTAATSHPLPPVPADPGAPAASDSTPSTPSSDAGGSGCHTVASAAGLTLAVVNDHTTIPCAQATDVVAAFHTEIAGRQPPGSDRPAGADVGGWHCVSGPPSAQGGTTCDRGSDEIMAAVVDGE